MTDIKHIAIDYYYYYYEYAIVWFVLLANA